MTATTVSNACSERRELEYIYQDGDGFVLLDPESEAMITVPDTGARTLGRYFKEGDRVGVLFCDGQPLFLDPPHAVPLRVAEADAPSTTPSKLALLETGVRVRVPASVAAGDTVLVDPRNGAYLGQAGSRER